MSAQKPFQSALTYQMFEMFRDLYTKTRNIQETFTSRANSTVDADCQKIGKETREEDFEISRKESEKPKVVPKNEPSMDMSSTTTTIIREKHFYMQIVGRMLQDKSEKSEKSMVVTENEPGLDEPPTTTKGIPKR